MQIIIIRSALIILLLSISLHSPGQVISVKQDGSGDFTLIQPAIDSAQNGDTILVWPGVYVENIFVIEKGITLGSLTMTTGDSSYISQTVINGNQTGSCIAFYNNYFPCEITGFTLTNGKGVPGTENGGGLLLQNTLRLRVNNCHIFENKNVGDAGGIWCVDSELFISATTIRNNHTYGKGGGMIIARSDVHFDSINRCSIYLNYASKGNDIHKSGDEFLLLKLDTFTVANPDRHYISNYQHENIFDNIELDALNTVIQPVNSNLYVDPQGSNENSGLSPQEPLKNIHYALLKIRPDTIDPKTIYLANGIYAPSTGEKWPFGLRSYVNIEGENRDSTILDGEDTTSFFVGNYITNNFNIRNLTLKNANCNYNFSNAGSGSFTLWENKHAMIENILLTNNKSIYYSAFLTHRSSIRFVNIKADSNIGGVAVMCCQGPDSALVLYDADTVWFENCRFHHNLPDYDTTTTAYGGGLAISGFSLYPDSLTAYIMNCEFSENIKNYESGPGTSALGTIFGSKAFVVNSTIGNNTGTSELGASMSVTYNSEMNIYNSIIYGNYPAQLFMINDAGQQSDLNIYNSLIQDGMFGIKVYSAGNNIYYDDSNIEGDPMWDTAGIFPYMLTAASPCIDAGTLDLPDPIQLPETDLAGNPRVYNGQIDMGAYEYGPWVGIQEIPQKTTGITISASPNPFFFETTIRYESQDEGRHAIYIYDLSGKRKATLAEFYSLPGKGTFVWDGTDDTGIALASGVYVIEMSIDGIGTCSIKVVKR